MFKKIVLLVFMACFAFCDFFYVDDMRGKKVKISDNLNNIATISDGFVEGVMTNFGVINKVKTIASWSFKRDYKYTYETKDNQTYTLRGWNTMKYLHPHLDNLPCINSPQGNIIDFETLAAQKPDLLILRVGDCTLRGDNKANMEKTFNIIEALDIPLFVLFSPSYYKNSDLKSMQEEIRLLAKIFKKEKEGKKLNLYLSSIEDMIKERTKNITQKTNILYIGLNKNIRKQGAAASVWGVDTAESYIIEKIANAKNAYQKKGTNIILSAEQINAINPDVIILPTSNGYHPPKELIDSKYFENLSELKAVKEKKVYAMPWSPMNCARRLEYPLDLLIIAKAAYPEKFKDIKIHQFALELYKTLYNVDENTAKALRSEQILDWTLENDF